MDYAARERLMQERMDIQLNAIVMAVRSLKQNVLENRQ